MNAPTCNCAELRVTDENGVRELPCPDYPQGRHDCAEVRRRNLLIQDAEYDTHKHLGAKGIITSDPQYGAKFTAVFARRMEELCRPAATVEPEIVNALYHQEHGIQ